MAVNSYSIDLLDYRDCVLKLQPNELVHILKSWRNSHETSNTCSVCTNTLNFPKKYNFTICCKRFYYKPTQCYLVKSLAVKTDGFQFALPSLKKIMMQKEIRSDQDFLIVPDPIYWQVSSTLVYDKTMKLVTKTAMTKKSNQILPPSKSDLFYKQIQEVSLNHGSLFKRSGGKNTYFRQIAFGKRVLLSARATIVPDSSLKPNQVTVPKKLNDNFNVLGKWILLNRMPSLQPENFVALKVKNVWEYPTIGLNLEIMESISGDFDGDEANVYILLNLQSQAEAGILLNSESNMKSFTLGLKLSPCQDMKMAHYLFPQKSARIISNDLSERDGLDDNDDGLKQAFKTVYDLHGSKKTFDSFDRMRKMYLDALQNDIAFGISLAEMQRLENVASECSSFEDFERTLLLADSTTTDDGCLVAQVKAGAKGSFYHLYQMFGSIGEKGENSFWKGIPSIESIDHVLKTYDGLLKSSNIWQPGYGYSKSVYNLQSLNVDYRGRLLDGGVVIERDVLDAMHYTDLMSRQSFQVLLKTEMMNA